MCVCVCVFRSDVITFFLHIVRNVTHTCPYTNIAHHWLYPFTYPKVLHLLRVSSRLFSRFYTDRLTWTGPCLIPLSYQILVLWHGDGHRVPGAVPWGVKKLSILGSQTLVNQLFTTLNRKKKLKTFILTLPVFLRWKITFHSIYDFENILLLIYITKITFKVLYDF